jgi:hypothetical protein
MTETLCILGRQPALGIAELESLYGADNLRPVGSTAALLSIDPPMILAVLVARLNSAKF